MLFGRSCGCVATSRSIRSASDGTTHGANSRSDRRLPGPSMTPVQHLQASAPRPYRSEAIVGRLPARSSGAAYPRVVAHPSGVAWSAESSAEPRSTSVALPSSEKRTCAGFRSPWTKPSACSAPSVAATCAKSDTSRRLRFFSLAGDEPLRRVAPSDEILDQKRRAR